MSSIKIATWNVNSLRVRLAHLTQWITTHEPDVLALQETKLSDNDFPFDAIKETGYHVISSGQRSYNGVALLSKEPLSEIVFDIPGREDPQRRVLGGTFRNVRILNLYVPNGENVLSKKYEYKLTWLNDLAGYLVQETEKYPNMVVVGDFNIAPHDIDVYNPQRWQGKVLFSEPERSAFQKLIDIGFVDCFRLKQPDGRAFTWWDYRLQAFARGWGLRIDHILANNSFSKQCISCKIDVLPRTWDRPSDHAPVLSEFSVV